MNIAVLCAIDCLQDHGIDRKTIDLKIAEWVESQGFRCDWRDLPEDVQSKLGRSLQKGGFEVKFKGAPICCIDRRSAPIPRQIQTRIH